MQSRKANNHSFSFDYSNTDLGDKYQIKSISNIQRNYKLSRENASNVALLAVVGALTIGASSATITLFKSSSFLNRDDYIIYNIPNEVTGVGIIKIKVLSDRVRIVLEGGKETDLYKGRKAIDLLNEASSRGMLYRDITMFEKNGSK